MLAAPSLLFLSTSPILVILLISLFSLVFFIFLSFFCLTDNLEIFFRDDVYTSPVLNFHSPQQSFSFEDRLRALGTRSCIVHLQFWEAQSRETKKKNKERTRQDILSSSFFLLFFELNFISVSFYDFSIFQTIWYKDELMYLYLATMPLSIGLVFFSLNDNNWLHISNLSVTRDLLELYVCFHTSSGTCDVLNWPESELVICITHPEEAPPQPTPSCFDNNDTERE